MKQLFIICSLICIISCGKDELKTTTTLLDNETISGTVSYDDPNQCCPQVEVAVIQYDSSNQVLDTLSKVMTDSIGFYEFDNILPEQPNLFITLVHHQSIISSKDNSPDGDEFEEGALKFLLGVYLEKDEKDENNDFVIKQTDCPNGSSISGSVYFIIDQDTLSTQGVIVNLYERLADGDTGALLQSGIFTNQYSFQVMDQLEALIVFDLMSPNIPQNYLAYAARDLSPDSDPTTGIAPNHIPVNIDKCEEDTDNNLYIILPSTVSMISGSVLLDEDGDGIGDIGISNQRVELYRRNTDNNPMTPLIAAVNTESDGSFDFKDVNDGEYVLYFIGDGSYDIVSGTDLDQETGEPTSSTPQFIPVNLEFQQRGEDSLNTYILTENTLCNAPPTLVPYWLLCDTSRICTYDRLPIIALDTNGDIITSAGGLYYLEWKDLLTNEVTVGDWAYYQANHPMELTITYPDGCVYQVIYMRACPQDLNGAFNLKLLRGGFNPDYPYNDDEIIWDFSPISNTLMITHKITSPASPNLIPEGTYDYRIELVGTTYELIIKEKGSTNDINLGEILFTNGQIILDNNIAADGLARYLEKQ